MKTDSAENQKKKFIYFCRKTFFFFGFSGRDLGNNYTVTSRNGDARVPRQLT